MIVFEARGFYFECMYRVFCFATKKQKREGLTACTLHEHVHVSWWGSLIVVRFSRESVMRQ